LKPGDLVIPALPGLGTIASLKVQKIFSSSVLILLRNLADVWCLSRNSMDESSEHFTFENGCILIGQSLYCIQDA
jgi:hypothetical protein